MNAKPAESLSTPSDMDRIEAAEDEFEEGLINSALEKAGLLPLPDATPTAGPAPAA